MNPMQQMLMQAQKMQRELTKAKNELAEKEFKISKAGMVEVVLKGDGTVASITIDKDAIDPDNVEMLQDTIKMAVNEGLEKVKEESDAIEEKITGKSGLPF